jgi:UDP-3-O-[3-hydroxymyristoyl] glucosamine N-acyltransferase
MIMNISLSRLAEILGGQLSGSGEIEIIGAGGIAEAGPGQITYIAGPQYIKDLPASKASAVLAPVDAPPLPLPAIRVKNPKLAFARVLKLYYDKPYTAQGISDKASIAPTATIGRECSIHAFAVIAERAVIGDRVTIHSGCFIGEDCRIGDDTVIHPNVTLGSNTSVGKRVIVSAGVVIGSDGFGFVTAEGRHHKIPQVGGVIIEDDVEIGANSAVDRATLGNTIIKQGTKIDNLVHIAHNVTIGEHCLLAGQVGVAGSSTLGKYVVLGGQAGVADHVKVGDGVMAGGGTAITRDMEPGQVIAGYNAMPLRDWLRVQVILPKLPELKKLIVQLEKQVQELKEKAG